MIQYRSFELGLAADAFCLSNICNGMDTIVIDRCTITINIVPSYAMPYASKYLLKGCGDYLNVGQGPSKGYHIWNPLEISHNLGIYRIYHNHI